jgi:CBS domain containing-hemolysin-like protein
VEVTTDQAPTYPGILGELLPTAWHRTEQYGINRVEANHGRLKARLRPMRGLKRERFGCVPAVGEAVEVDDWRIEVLAVQRRAITRLRLVPLQAAQRRSGDQPTPE